MCSPSDCKVHSGFFQEFLSLQIRPVSSRPCQCITMAKAPPKGFGTEETSTVSSVRLKRETECLCKPSFALLSGFDMARQKKEGKHGVTTIHTQDEFRADRRHYNHHHCAMVPGSHQGHDH